MPSIDRRYLNTAEAAHYLGLSESSLEKRRVAGNGPIFSRLGKCVRYERSALDEWARSDRRRSTAEPITEKAAHKRTPGVRCDHRPS